MSEDLYTQALSLFNQCKYEEALKRIEQSSLSTLREKKLLEQCQKQILEQYCYLINESIRQKDYRSAKSIKDEYQAKFGKNYKIEAIKIPEIASPLQNEVCSDSTERNPNTYLKIALGIILFILTCTIIIVVWNRNIQKDHLATEENVSVENDSDSLSISKTPSYMSNSLAMSLECEGDMIGYPIRMNINIDENNRISGKYINVKYNVTFTLEGTRSEDGVLNITAHHPDAIFYFTLKPVNEKELVGYGSNGKNKLEIHLTTKTS